jgi:hypothetical protein
MVGLRKKSSTKSQKNVYAWQLHLIAGSVTISARGDISSIG